MIKQYGKRILSFALALIMIFSVMPGRAYAEEEHDHDHESEDMIASSEVAESETLVALRAEIAAHIAKLGITPDMSDVMLLYAYGNHSSYEEAQASVTKLDEFEQKAMQLSAAERKILAAEENTKLCERYREVVLKAYGTQSIAATISGINFSTSSANSSVSEKNGTVTATVSDSGSSCDGYTANTMVLYITNNSGALGSVSFKIGKSNASTIFVGDKDGKSTGESLMNVDSYKKSLANGESFTILITSSASGNKCTVTISEIELITATTGFTVTVDYVKAHGDVTSSKESTSTEADGIVTLTIPDVNAAEGVKLTANSSDFLCWIDQNNKLLSTTKSYDVYPSGDTYVKAVTTGGNAYFLVNGEWVYNDLNEAAQKAASSSNKTVVLMNNGTLPAGDYTIPSGVTLLIPFDDANTLYTDEPVSVESKQVTPTAYRTLTMASGANITINGAVSLSAKHSSTQLHNGRPVISVSFIRMQSNSKITVNKGGNLYAWGYITGDGAVEVKSGATVYEYFQVLDWRGGSAGTGMIGNDERVFLMSQYYIQNIEVPMTIHAGATERAYMSVELPVVGAQGSNVPFIGSSNCMFTISEGYIIKDYREGTGRLDIDVYGDISVSGISISLSFYNVNSADYELPLNGNLTIEVHSGNINLNQNVAFQPGSELYVHEGAVCNLGAENSIYVYSQKEWGPYVFNDGSEYKSLPYVPGGNGTEGRGKDALVQIDGKAVLNGTAYSTVSGADIISGGNGVIEIKQIGTQTVTYQAVQSGTSISYDDIDITPFKLKNADGTYVETKYTPGTYTYIDGVWVKSPCTHELTEVITKAPTCTETGLKTQTCKDTVNCGLVNTDVEIPALGHTEVNDAAEAPTCTETGLTAGKHCSVCGVVTVAQETVAALGHSYNAVVTAPTCTVDGYTTHTCSVCGNNYTDTPVAALGHSYEAVVTEPTCTVAGYTTHTCSVCGHSYTDTPVAELGHTEVVDKAVDPTCTETGLTEGKHCSVCGEVTLAQVTVEALGHTEVVDKAVAPTCTETGLTEGKHCSVCGEVTVKQETVASLGHDYVPSVTAPDCENEGYTTHICSRCDDSYKDSEVPALGHDWQWITDKEATVLESGLKHEECTRCHDKRNENTEIPVLTCAHTGTMTAIAYKAPTCTDEGNNAYWYCSACRNYYNDAAGQYEIEKNSWIISSVGHDYTAVVTAPTCTEAGFTTYTCNNCGDNYTDTPVAELGHTEVVDKAVAPTCTETGLAEGKHCSVCGEVTVAQQTVPALGHTETIDASVAPTCTETGLTEGAHCSVCGEVTVAQVEIPAQGHGVMEFVEAIAATCQKEGTVAHYHCATCSKNYEDKDGKVELTTVKTPVDPDNHAFADEGEVTAATCQAEGKIVYACENDGCTATYEETLPVDPEGHVWDEGEPYKNHSCNSASYTKYECTLCDEVKLVVVREQHFRVPIAEEIPATCTTDGMTSGWKCEKCDEFWIPQEVIPALGHDWNNAYPCQSESSACTRCDLHFDSKQEHLVVVDEAVTATCTSTGLTEGSHCGYCGEVLVAQTEIPMTEHNWFVDELETPATCTSIGHKAGATYCVDCDYDEDPIPMLEHEWVHRDAKKATYTAIGWNEHDYCIICNATKTPEQYESEPCDHCGENPQGYIEIPKVEVQRIETWDEYLANISYLEMMAAEYAKINPNADPLGLVLNYLRTAVSNYTTGSWAIMAGPEDKDFLKFVQEMEDTVNSNPDIDVWVNVSGLKKIKNYYIDNFWENNYYTGNRMYAISGHFYGTMDMTYHNKGSQNHADVGGWVGDLTDLLSMSDEFGVPANLTLEEKVAYITKNYMFKNNIAGSVGSFGPADLYADLEAFYFMNELITNGYETGDLSKMMKEYFKTGLTLQQRVSYLLTNRLDGLSTRKDLRTAVYNAYTSNKLIATLEGTRNFNAAGEELNELRKAVCYAFADEMCRIAGDYVEDLTNPRYTVFDTETKILAPGVTQQISYATNADGKQIVFYIATADVKRDDVGLWVNYYDRDPGTPENPVWKNNSVPSSAQIAQDRYGDPSSPDYIENFNVIASTNAGGYDMSDTATPGGLMVMNGVEWHPQSGTAGFFAILSDGTAYMGTHDEYRAMMDAGLIQEAIGGFGEFVVQNGEVVGSATYSDAPRTSVGITATGRVVIMCIDGRQAPFSSGASLQDVGYIMREAGCVIAINLDGGGSTTFVARQPGEDELTVMNRPSDGYPRNVSTNLLIYSTAPSSTAFDHAVIESEYDYATINTPVQMTAAGVSPAGNAVDIPEGATWVVGNEDWASITEDGVFTGKRLGEVYVYLMLDGVEIGSKLMTLTNPDQVYFEKNKVDVIYGSGVTLPLRARVGGKPIAINPGNVTFTLSAPAAGTMDGFTFQAVESSLKTLTITAAINDNAKASINVMLYQQGENSFDFDKATGGDRTLAWDRQVSNSKLEDGNIYNVIDPSKDMVASYTFALDMTTIPIPARLEELTYMLPGGTLEGATAWSFLLSLAQRISDLSWVKATIDFDDRFDVDYTELKILNEYFEMKGVEFDETTNTLTVTMHWIRQSQVIEEATANPLCLINGIKLTPKEDAWTDVTKIDAVTSGTISYEIYMRASGLYGFAQKPENQSVFGIYPYRNPADTSDAGGYFHDTYAQITDTFTLVNVLKEGWVNEDGGFAYYVNGERLYGVQKVEGYYYDFGENGVNVGQTKLTGLFYDEEAGAYRYSYIGELAGGWQSINGEWYYFSSSTMKAVSGKKLMNGIYLSFEENGKLISGGWARTLNGVRYYYGPDCYWIGWAEIDGEMYYFENGYRKEGIQRVRHMENQSKHTWYDFGEDGIARVLPDGLFINPDDGKCYYLIDGVSQVGLHKVDGDYYFFTYDGPAITSREYYAWETHCDLPCNTYAFGADGKMVDGLTQMSDGLYFYINGKVAYDRAGLTKIGDDYYFVNTKGKCVTGTYYCWATNCDLPCGEYEFGSDGKMLNGLVQKSDGVYCYYNGKIDYKKAGLTKIGDDYYFVNTKGKCVTGIYYCWATNCDLPCGEYEFGSDGKMLNGIVEKSDGVYCYYNGKIDHTKAGLTKVGDDYYFVNSKGKCVTGSYNCWATNCDLPIGTYEFGADGKMLNGLVQKSDGVYCYYNGKIDHTKAGLTKIGDDYYFVNSKGKCVTGSYNCWATNCDLPIGTYEFGADGKMLHGLVQKADGLYCYVYGKMGGNAGLIKLDDDYYFVASNGKCVTGKYYAWATHCDLPIGNYEFGADGKMLDGFVTKDTGIYYYITGNIAKVGLHYIDGYYYFVTSTGKLITNRSFYVWETNGLLVEKTYIFDELGRIIG